MLSKRATPFLVADPGTCWQGRWARSQNQGQGTGTNIELEATSASVTIPKYRIRGFVGQVTDERGPKIALGDTIPYKKPHGIKQSKKSCLTCFLSFDG